MKPDTRYMHYINAFMLQRINCDFLGHLFKGYTRNAFKGFPHPLKKIVDRVLIMNWTISSYLKIVLRKSFTSYTNIFLTFK
jgi:hypothetical protein